MSSLPSPELQRRLDGLPIQGPASPVVVGAAETGPAQNRKGHAYLVSSDTPTPPDAYSADQRNFLLHANGDCLGFRPAHAINIEWPQIEMVLPHTEDSLLAAESLADALFHQLKAGRDNEALFALRLVINEAFRNSLAQVPVTGRYALVRIALRSHPGGVEILVTDPGPGFAIKGVTPPYPTALVHKSHDVSRVMGATVVARVLSSVCIEFGGREDDVPADASREDLLRDLKTTGMGILSILRYSLMAGMTYDPAIGNTFYADVAVDWSMLRHR